MQVRDNPSWTQQVSLLESQEEVGPQFLNAIVFWCETADKLMEESTTDIPPIQAIRLALPILENHIGSVDMLYFGQLLLVISMHWVHGVEMANTLTNIEMKLYNHAVQMKQAELQHLAEQAMEPATIEG